MQAAVEIELYETLKAKVGEKEARTLVEYIETKVEKRFEEKKDLFVTKEDLAKAKAELEVKMEKIRADLETKIEKMRSDLETRMEKIRADLEAKIEKMRSDIIKWMFIFWAGQIGALIAILQIFFRK